MEPTSPERIRIYGAAYSNMNDWIFGINSSLAETLRLPA
jgi:hypothetical protein